MCTPQVAEQASIQLEDCCAQYFEDYRRKHIGRIIDRLNAVVQTDDLILKKSVDYFFSSPGKYFRPLLTLMVCEVVGGREEDAIDYACAVELIHSSSLIFDDLPCMDNADMRRGQACLHRQFGEAVAMLTAIYFLSTAFDLAGQSRDKRKNAVSVLAQAVAVDGMVPGQIRDISGHGRTDRVRKMKAGPLLRAAAKLGAYAADANEQQRETIVSYADALSLAFQIRDDVLDKEVGPGAQRRARMIASKASGEILGMFGNSAAALSLAALAFFAAKRWQ